MPSSTSPAHDRLALLMKILPERPRGSVFFGALNRPPTSADGKGTWTQRDFQSIESLAEFCDRSSESGDVYVALAAFEPGKGRTKDGVVAKGVLSADVDAKALPGATHEERLARAAQVARALPAPHILVASGGGYQPHLLLPEGDRVQDFSDVAKGRAHVETLAIALRLFLEEQAKEMFGTEVSLDHTHTPDRVWRTPPAWNCKASDGARILTADRSRWRPVELVTPVGALAGIAPANLEFLIPYVGRAVGASVASVAAQPAPPGAPAAGFSPDRLPERLRNDWPLAAGDQSENDFAVAAALVEGGFTPSVVADGIRTRRAALPDPEDRRKGERPDYVAKTVDAAFGRTRPRPDPTARSSASSYREAAWPAALEREALHGLAGEFVRLVDPHTEADPASLLSQFLVGFGSVIDRRAHYVAEADRHFMNLFLVLVGETSKGRKGSSWGHVRRALGTVDPIWEGTRLGSGLSSGEGLIWQVRDPIVKTVAVREGKKRNGPIIDYEEEIVDPGVEDKRLLVVEAEFASALKVMGREGNTLSPVIRTAWDTGDLRSMTKNSPAKATGAHIAVIGHITRDELLRHLSTTEAANGFGNRILWSCTRRSKLLPEGGRVPPDQMEMFATRLREVVAFASKSGEMTRDDGAKGLWREIYGGLSAGKPGLLGAMTGRAEAQVLRLSCIYALLDKSAVVTEIHLRAGMALWNRMEQSASYVFGSRLGDPTADEALRALRSVPAGMARTQLRDHFGRHAKSDELDRALRVLKDAGLAYVAWRDTGGRRAEVWFAVHGGATEATYATEAPPAGPPAAPSVASVASVAVPRPTEMASATEVTPSPGENAESGPGHPPGSPGAIVRRRI